MKSNIISFIGNEEILNEKKTAFFCSRKCPPNLILKSYDLATSFREKGICVISGFHTRIEQDVFDYLIKGSQPVIKAPARGKLKVIPQKDKQLIDEGKLLYIFFFQDSVTMQTKQTCLERNQKVVDVADEVFIAYAHAGGATEELAKYSLAKGKVVYTFDTIENMNLLKFGVNSLEVGK